MKTKYWLILGAFGFATLLYKCNEEPDHAWATEQIQAAEAAASGRQLTKEEMEQVRIEQQKAVNEWNAKIQQRVDAEVRRASGCGGVDLAVAAESYVRRNLKTPSVAEFSTYTERMHGEKDGRLYYLGYVDSQNGFGAMVRLHFKVWMTCRNGAITVVDAEFE